MVARFWAFCVKFHDAQGGRDWQQAVQDAAAGELGVVGERLGGDVRSDEGLDQRADYLAAVTPPSNEGPSSSPSAPLVPAEAIIALAGVNGEELSEVPEEPKYPRLSRYQAYGRRWLPIGPATLQNNASKSSAGSCRGAGCAPRVAARAKGGLRQALCQPGHPGGTPR